jgi:hypothetical protein
MEAGIAKSFDKDRADSQPPDAVLSARRSRPRAVLTRAVVKSHASYVGQIVAVSPARGRGAGKCGRGGERRAVFGEKGF